MNNFVSLLGIGLLLLVAWVMSNNRKVVNTRVIIGGMALQLLFGVFIFVFPLGRWLFQRLNDAVFVLLSYANQGTVFLFGNLAISPGKKGSMGMFLAFQVLPAVIFFAAVVGLLYYFGVMQFLIRVFATIFSRLMGVSGAEALCVSSNIFVGVESGLTIRPYIEKMTSSELFTILASGMATIASTVLAINAGFLQKSFPSIAGHLISASLLSAPAVLVVTKLMFPETDTPETAGQNIMDDVERSDNWVESIVTSSMEGVRLAVGIGAMLLVFVSFLSMFNGFLGWGGGLFGIKGLTLQGILGYVFYPFVLAMGVPAADASQISQLLGLRAVITEVPAYNILAGMVKSGAFQDPRSVVIATYCLCGFAHIPAVAIFVGGFAAIAPSRSKDLSRLGFRALIAATIACLMTGAVAGLFYTGGDTVLLGKAKQQPSQSAKKTPGRDVKKKTQTPPKARAEGVKQANNAAKNKRQAVPVAREVAGKQKAAPKARPKQPVTAPAPRR